MINHSVFNTIKQIVLLVGAFISIVSCGEKNPLEKIAELPPEVKEASGIAFLNNAFWMINDSDNRPYLYKLDPNGVLLDSIWIVGKNTDWEDLTIDNKGNLYIGDCGDNKNNRKDLTIYKILNHQLSLDTIIPQKIVFNYVLPEKKKKRKKINFDCEAIVWQNDSIVLFSKNKKNPDHTLIYKIPDQPGSYLISSIKKIKTKFPVTSACLIKNTNQIILLTNQSYILLNKQLKKPKRYDLKNSKKEGICTGPNGNIYIVDEATKKKENYLYLLTSKHLK